MVPSPPAVAAAPNVVKKHKSYLFWLGANKGSMDTVFGICPSRSSERYLGIQLATEFDASLNWAKVIDTIASSTPYWSSYGLSIFGRSLMINSCMLSKLWFVCMHVPPSTEIIKSINTKVNHYLRKCV